MIRKIGSKFKVISHTTGKTLGTYDSRKAAEKALRQKKFYKRRSKPAQFIGEGSGKEFLGKVI